MTTYVINPVSSILDSVRSETEFDSRYVNVSGDTMTGDLQLYNNILHTLNYSMTVPATGTVALLGTANIFTTQQMVDGTSDQIQLRVQAHSTQTSNLHTFEKSDGTVYGGIDSVGRYFNNLGASVTNLFIGGLAGNVSVSGTGNTAIGYQALQSISSGINNFACGYLALNKITTASNCVALGSTALSSCTGKENTAIGTSSLTALVGGERNVAVGYGTLITGSSTTNSVALGYLAGWKFTSNRGIFIGSTAGAYQTTTSDLFIVDNLDYPGRSTAANEAQNSYLYGSTAAGGFLQLNIPTTTNNAVIEAFKLQSFVSTASTGGANGFGVGLPFLAETATDGTYQKQGLISTSWIDATNATRKAKLSLSAYDTAQRLGIEIEADGSVAKLGFYGVNTVVRPTALTTADANTINTGDATTDTVIANMRTRIGELETKLQGLGLLT